MEHGALPGDRLDSWKDIAAYLKRDVSTVQRWEKREAMPVHRHVHDKLGSVYAFRAELDAWLRNRRPRESSQRAHLPARGLAALFAINRVSAVSTTWVVAGAGLLALLAAAIFVQLRSASAAPVRAAGTANPSAQQEYEIGSYYLWRYDEEHLERAVEHFERATKVDPAYAAAYAALSNAWWARGMFGSGGLKAAELPARAAAESALKLNDQLAASYVALGDVKRLFDRDAAGAEQMFRRALALDRDDVAAHHSYALLLMALGRFPEALSHIHRAASLRPLAPAIQSNYGRVLYRAGRYEEALTRTERALELEPGMRGAYARLGDIYEQLGQYERALQVYERSGTRRSTRQAQVARILARMGRPHESRALLDELAATAVPMDLSLVAAAHAALGETAQAVRLLASATERRDPGLPYFPVDPKFVSLRSAPEWPELLRRTHFHPAVAQ